MDQPTDPAVSAAPGEKSARVPAPSGSPERIPEGRYRTRGTNLLLWQRSRAWWGSEVGFGAKLRYYPDMIGSYVRCMRGQARTVRYLDRTFAYDNVAAPLALQTCPREVGRDVLGNLRPGFQVRSVLDVGGHLGQFAVTLRHFVPEAQVDVFEPNGQILPHLEANTAAMDGVRVWPYALAPTRTDEMFVDPSRSSTGSLLPDLVDCHGTPRRIPVRSVADPSSVTGHQEYDLVRISVGGGELGALKCMGGMTVHYLYVELTGPRGVFPHSELLMLVRRQFGDFRIVFQGGGDRRTGDLAMMLEFAG